jgi:hypothetical protein
MYKLSLFVIASLAFCVGSCANSEQLDDDFMNRSDCYVYENEVNTENFAFGTVKSIDTAKASGCVKMQLSNVYLLYIDTICVAVYKDHPKKNIDFIKSFVKEFQSDTTRLSSFIRSDSSITIVVDRLCKDSTNDVRYGQYVDWREKEYSTKTPALSKVKDDLIMMWYSWKE